MSLENIIALALFAFVSSITPGPNNLMLLSSGVNFGFTRTIPHMLGIAIGFGILIGACGAGLGALIKAFPSLHLMLKIAGAGYLLYLAWRIAMSRTIQTNSGKQRPMNFLEAAAFQWVNPKAWTMALTAIALYTNIEQPVLSVCLIVGIFVAINLPSICAWATCGTMLRNFLSDPVRLKYFNIFMGVLLVLTIIPMVR